MKKVIVELLMILFLSSSVIGQTFNSRSFSIKNEKDNALLINGKGENVINSTNPIDLYNGACSSALKGDTNTAFKLLNKSADYGYRDLEHINQDLDLCILRKSDSWRQVINRINENNENYVTSDKLLGLIIESIKSNITKVVAVVIAQFWHLGRIRGRYSYLDLKRMIKKILIKISFSCIKNMQRHLWK
jgi:type IV secretory pathway VirB2 component (pilin)